MQSETKGSGFEKFGIDHISYSSFNKFETCPRCWYYYYVKYPEQKGEDSFPLVLGDAYHQAIEAMYNGKTKEQCLEVFDTLIRGSSFNSLVAKDTATMRSAIEYYYSSVYPLYRSRVDVVELQADIEMPDIEIPFRFRMDLVTKDGVLIDHKTAGRYTPSVKDNQQLNLYSYAYMLDTGRLPRSVELHIAKKYPIGQHVEVKTYSPSLPEVMRTVSRLRSFVTRVKIGDLPQQCGKFCEGYSWREEADSLLIKTNGDPHID